jgi:hypothetical protein
VIKIETTSGSSTLELSGTASKSATLEAMNVNDTTNAAEEFDSAQVDWGVIARDSAVGPFARIDAHGTSGETCKFWGMIIPSG